MKELIKKGKLSASEALAQLKSQPDWDEKKDSRTVRWIIKRI